MSGFNIKNLKPRPVPELTDKLKNSAFLAPYEREKALEAVHVTTGIVENPIINTVEVEPPKNIDVEPKYQDEVQPLTPLIFENNRDNSEKAEPTVRDKKPLAKTERGIVQIHMKKKLISALSKIAVDENKHRNRVLEELLEQVLKSQNKL